MELKGTFRFHRLEKVLPKRIPKKINNIEKLFDAYGVKERSIEYPANSLVIQFVPIVFCCLNNATIANVKDITNTNRTVSPTASNIMTSSAGSEDSRSIILGTGSTAVTLNDYALATRITHGLGAGQLYYNIMVSEMVFPFQIVGSSAYWSILKPISNFSGSDIDVYEAGVYMFNNAQTFMIERTVLSSPYSFIDNVSVVAEYIVKVTV